MQTLETLPGGRLNAFRISDDGMIALFLKCLIYTAEEVYYEEHLKSCSKSHESNLINLKTYLSKCSSRYFPNRLELSFFTVLALPNDSKSGVASMICKVSMKNYLSSLLVKEEGLPRGFTCSVIRLPFASFTAAKY